MAQVLVIADDLTGSNATGALYARLGLRAMTVAAGRAAAQFTDNVDVLVVNTASRHLPAERAYRAVRKVVEESGDTPLTVKRVDTTLRGNVGAELEAVVSALAERHPRSMARVIAVPAFPDAGRTTVGGMQLLDGQPISHTDVSLDLFDPVPHSRMRTILARQTQLTSVEIVLDVIDAGADAVAAALDDVTADVTICDATSNEHLRTIARAVTNLPGNDRRPWIVMDSGPFGALLASALEMPLDVPSNRILALVASRTSRTREQLAHAEASIGARWIDIDPARPDPESLLARLHAVAELGTTTIGVRVASDCHDDDTARAHSILSCLAELAPRAVGELRPGGLYVSGGDAAAAVMDALGADGFAIEAQIVPLAVAGRLAGGPHDGLLFATKGGLIGGPDATSACIDHLRAAHMRLRVRAQPPSAPQQEIGTHDLS